MRFNFGPIARTVVGGNHSNTFNLAGLPLHESLDALMAATSRDEFVAWLWHDLYKPVFYWVTSGSKFLWIHTPGLPPFVNGETQLARVTGITTGLVRAHHVIPKSLSPAFDLKSGEQRLSFTEGPIIEDQFEQTGLGRSAYFVQLVFAVEPTMTTAVVRAVIADSFIEVVVQGIAKSLHRVLASKHPSFSRVRFVFETRDNIAFSTPPTETEIWQEVGQHFGIRPVGGELAIKHLTPVTTAESFDTEVIIDLSGQALTPEQMGANTLGLAELLMVYQDSRTVIMAVPQPGIYKPDVKTIASNVLRLTRAKLEALDICTVKDGVDLLEAAFEAQVEIREVPASLGIPPDPKNPRPIHLVVRRPMERLDDARSNGRQCRLCASTFKSSLPIADMTRSDFTDTEYIGLTGDLCPLCRIFWYNTHQYAQHEKTRGAQGMRKSLRGSFALISPSSRVDVQDHGCQLVERPPLDGGGRFASPDPAKPLFQRVTVTQQEYALFTQISRRVIASLWRQVEPTAPLPLPYLGSILLTHREGGLVRQVLPALRGLFNQVTLLAYPFEARVVPSVELALEVVLTDFKQHHTKYTSLKSRPMTLPVHPDSRFFVLADNAMQIEISHDWFEAYDRVATLVNQMSFGQRQEWMKRVTEGTDLATAFYESTQTRLKQRDDDRAFNTTAAFWTTQFGNDPAQAWTAYEQILGDLREIFSRYPMMTEMFPTTTERKESKDDRGNATDTEEADGSSVGRGTGRRRRAGTSKRPCARRQASS